MTDTNSLKIAGLNSAEEALNRALTSTLAEFSPVCLQGGTSLTWFNFLLDHVIEKAPSNHPLECARELYLRLTPGADRKAIADAFTMGGLVATATRGRSAEFNAKAAKESAEALKQITTNWESFHQTQANVANE